jgi:hypothetical protein
MIALYLSIISHFCVGNLAINNVNPWPLVVQSCNETLQAGNDTTVCHPGGTFTLNGYFSGNEIASIEWTPADGLSDPTSLTPTATVNQTITYTLTVLAPSQNNLIVNGDFEAGNTGFTSDYWYGNPGLSPGGYSVQSDPTVCNGGFSPCGDHTSGSGNMMVVDGATSPDVYFWCQTVPVLPNTDYYFEFYVASAYPASPAEVGALFNGVLLGSAFATSTTCEWIQYSTVWNSGGATSVTICLEDLNIIGFGNDFLVDDVFLREICKYEEEVTITVLDEIVENQSYQICEGEVIQVGGQSFQNGGQYEISLSSWQGCDSTLMVDIEVITVEAFIEPPAAISCLFPESALDGSLSWGSYGIDSYLWTTINGLILSNPTQNSVSVGAGGTYQLLVSTNTGSVICWDSITVDVPVDTLSPDFSILTPDPLSCQDSILDLEAILNNLPMGGSLDWTSQDGLILNGQSSLTPTVKGIGTYTLTVTNPENGCTASKSVEVIGDTLRPVINLEAIPKSRAGIHRLCSACR